LMENEHRSSSKPMLIFCVFRDGELRFYSEKGGNILGCLSLPGRITKVKAEADVPTKLPHRFSVSSTEVTRIEGRRFHLGGTRTLTFSAPTHDLMKEWANSVHLWRRMNWKDNIKFFDSFERIEHTEERAFLSMFLKTNQDQDKVRVGIRVSKLRSLSPFSMKSLCSDKMKRNTQTA
jgi:hypothetical protein